MAKRSLMWILIMSDTASRGFEAGALLYLYRRGQSNNLVLATRQRRRAGVSKVGNNNEGITHNNNSHAEHPATTQ